jgi:thiosulfate/3-mercaptopyruvate sulfurtransferase
MMKTRLKLGGAALALLAAAAVHAESLPGPVVSPQWLHDHLDAVTVLDVRSDVDGYSTAAEFETDAKTGTKKLVTVGGHIGPALLVDFDKIRTTRMVGEKKVEKMLPDREAFTALMQSVGLDSGKPVVITANGQTVDEVDMAARLYWSLKVYGQNQMAILDGGDAAWITAGYPMSTDKSVPKKGDWAASAEHKELVAELVDVQKAAADGKTQLVDARSLPQYLGLTVKKPLVTAAGHVAGAVNLPTDVHAKASGPAQVFLSADEYRGVMKALNVKDGVPTIAYCNTGHLASGGWFIMSEVLGNKDVRLYDGSMHEWTTFGNPVVGLK